MKKITFILIFAFMLMFVFNSIYAFAGDMPSEWAREEVENAVSRGYVQPAITNNYTAPMTRIEFAELSVRFAMTELGYDDEEFKKVLGYLREPVSFNDTYSEYAVMAYQMGVAYGTGNGCFEPYRSITREEAATMLERLYDSYGNIMSYGDVDRVSAFEDRELISEWAYNKIQWCVYNGIMRGVSETMFDPKGNYTREQAIATFSRLDSLEDWMLNNHKADIQANISLEDAVSLYLDSNKNISEIARYETGYNGIVLQLKDNGRMGAPRYSFILITESGKVYPIGRIPEITSFGGTPPITKVELLDNNSVLYFEVYFSADDLTASASQIKEPGIYWEKVDLMTLESENGYITNS